MIIEGINLSLDELKTLVLESLQRCPSTQYVRLSNDVAKLAVQKKIVPNPIGNTNVSGETYELTPYDKHRIIELIWILVVERILTIGRDGINAGWPFLDLTEYGKQVAGSDVPIPHDPTGYLSFLKARVPDIDPIIVSYMEECLNTYNINALLSSTVMLGCASEKALLLLIDVYSKALSDTKRQEKFEKAIQRGGIKSKFDVFWASLTTVLGNLPKDLLDGLQNELLGVFEMIRNTRNDAGHPTGNKVPRIQLFSQIQVFIPYCEKIYRLIDYFANNKVT